MNARNAYDRVLELALLGATPTTEDLDAVPVPAGTTASALRSDLLRVVSTIGEHKASGRRGLARQIAAEAQQKYAAGWDDGVPPDPDPHADLTDPHELAAAIKGRRIDNPTEPDPNSPAGLARAVRR